MTTYVVTVLDVFLQIVSTVNTGAEEKHVEVTKELQTVGHRWKTPKKICGTKVGRGETKGDICVNM